MDSTYHYPPELMSLLIDTIPLLFKTKKDVLLFFRGAGCSMELMQDLQQRVLSEPDKISKYEIARTLLGRLNDKGEVTLGQRREIVKRVSEFDDFSTCWPNDQLKAKGLVGEIRRVVDVKDSFTRMKNEADGARKKHLAEQQQRLENLRRRQSELSAIKEQLASLFAMQNSQKRGKVLEDVLNRLFKCYDILIREAFTVSGSHGEGVFEQIDGAIEFGNEIYLVEMKWWSQPLGPAEVAPHIVKVYSRSGARGIFISASGYTEAAINTSREALREKVFILCSLKEILDLLEKENDLKELLNRKIHAAILDKTPLYEPQF